MKIAEISTYRPEQGGGLEGVVANISLNLVEKGHDISMYYRGEPVSEENWKENPVKNYPSIIGHSYYNFVLSRKDFSKYDLVHAHGQNAAWKLANNTDTPLITTFHGTYKGVENVRGKFYNPLIWFEKIGGRKSDKVVACSSQVKQELIDYYSISEEKIEVIHNGVDTEFFHPEEKEESKENLGLETNQKYLCWIGSSPERKGLNEAIETVSEMPDYKLIVAGTEDEDTENVIYLGRVPEDKLNSFYNASDALIFPTKYEGHPLVVLESLATHTPVITTEAANVEIGEKGEHYELIEENSVDELTDFLENRKRDFEFIQDYTWEKVAERYEKAFKNLIE